MPKETERMRLAALRGYKVLDTPNEAAFDRIVRLAMTIFQAPMALISFIDEDRQWFKANCSLNYSQTPRDESLCTYTIMDDAPLVVSDTSLDARFRHLVLVAEPPHVRSYIGVPLRTQAGHKIGTLCVMDIAVRHYDAAQIAVLQVLAQMVMDELELRLAASIDGLTGALNRRAFLTAAAGDIACARQHGLDLSCVLIDLDHFKRINDGYGHAFGDRALQQVVALLKAGLRDEDYIGRLGGEEFAVVMPGAGRAIALEIGERLRCGVMQGWLPTPSGELRLTVSVGAATLAPADGRIEDLLRRADDALYAAKSGGRNRLVCEDELAAALR